MATVEELMDRYQTDAAFKKEVDDILADGKVTLAEFLEFAKKHDVKVSVLDFPKYMKLAKENGLIK